MAKDQSASREVAALCAALSHEVRQSILISLADGPQSLAAISAHTGQTVRALKRHLDPLLSQSLVEAHREDDSATYRLGCRAQVQFVCGGVQLDLVTLGGNRICITRR
jgi:DNA-binding transcriptional ArsR family regulator